MKFGSFINLPCGHVMSHKKFGPDRFSRFDVYWIQKKQTDNPNLYIGDDLKASKLSLLPSKSRSFNGLFNDLVKELASLELQGIMN